MYGANPYRNNTYLPSCRKGNEGVLHKIPIVVGNLRELNRHTPSDFAKFP